MTPFKVIDDKMQIFFDNERPEIFLCFSTIFISSKSKSLVCCKYPNANLPVKAKQDFLHVMALYIILWTNNYDHSVKVNNPYCGERSRGNHLISLTLQDLLKSFQREYWT